MMFDNKRVLITGATGFIGRRVCEMLKGRGLQVVGAVRHLSATEAHGFELRALDMSNAGKIRVVTDVLPEWHASALSLRCSHASGITASGGSRAVSPPKSQPANTLRYTTQ